MTKKLTPRDEMVAKIFELFNRIYGVDPKWEMVDFKSDSDLEEMIEDLEAEV